jgi:hypothetical protein
MLFLHQPSHISWKIIKTNVKTGESVESEGKNLVTNAGRDLLLKDLFSLSGSAGVVALAPGASTTTADVSDTRLTHELIDTTGRKPLTNTNGDPLSASDIADEEITISSCTYYKKIVAQAEWPAGEGTGHQFAEYMLNSSITSPATYNGTSGTMFNHYIDPSPSTKGEDTAIQIQITVRM